MNIRKTLLLVLILAIASLGLTLTGCEKKSDHPTGEHPTTETATKCPKCGEVAGSEACCMTKAAKEAVDEAAGAVKEAAAEHPTGEHPK
ncbi:MAG: hypothetical protein ACYSOH_02730 [Planctomycetota bacterium]|jgi:hypothetical protein